MKTDLLTVRSLQRLSLAAVVLLSACQTLPNRSKPTVSEQAATASPQTAAPSPALPPVVATRQPAQPTVQANVQQVQYAAPHQAGAVQPAGYYQPGTPGTLPSTAWTGDDHTQSRYYSNGGQNGCGGHGCDPGGVHAGGCPCCGGGGNYGKFRFSDDVLHLQQGGGQWKPPGIAGPWPQDEYVCDGGDFNADVRVKQDWTVVGLDKEDTIAHYDTLDGKTEVAPSNSVCIYAPRFAAVRKVASPIVYEGQDRIAAVDNPERVNLHEETRVANNINQPIAPQAEVMLDGGVIFREQTRGIGLDGALAPLLARDNFLPYEDLALIQRGVFQGDEKARLAARTQAAITWTGDQAVQIVIDGIMANEGKGVASAQETVVYELEGKPRLRICKIASTSEAKVGEQVEFTLRFDNVGEQKIGNVTIIDHLPSRLEYAEGSQSSTLESNFVVTPMLDSTVLRWEIVEPLDVNQGGLIRFRTKVR